MPRVWPRACVEAGKNILNQPHVTLCRHFRKSGKWKVDKAWDIFLIPRRCWRIFWMNPVRRECRAFFPKAVEKLFFVLPRGRSWRGDCRNSFRKPMKRNGFGGSTHKNFAVSYLLTRIRFTLRSISGDRPRGGCRSSMHLSPDALWPADLNLFTGMGIWIRSQIRNCVCSLFQRSPQAIR